MVCRTLHQNMLARNGDAFGVGVGIGFAVEVGLDPDADGDSDSEQARGGRPAMRNPYPLPLPLLLPLLLALAESLVAGAVRNGSLREAWGGTMTPDRVAQLRKDGWTCPDAKDWPHSWGGQGAGMTIEWPATGGRDNDGFGRLSGGVDGYVNGYWACFFKNTQILSVWARGKGTLRVGLMAYKFSEDRKTILPGGRMPGFDIKVNSDKWVRYRYLMKKPAYELNGHPLFQAPEGTIDFDDVDIIDSDPVLDLIVAEENRLYGTGALVEDLDMARVDATFADGVKKYDAAVQAFRARVSHVPKDLAKPMLDRIAALGPYVHTDGITMVGAVHYNDMIVMARVLNRLAEKPVVAAVAVEAKGAGPATAVPHYPGRRDARPNTVTITRIRSNKVRYVENESATTVATIVNKAAAAVSGTLRARMILDLDTVRDLASRPLSLAPGEELTWTFSYSVGPETYGRAIEVECVDNAGETLDRWQEYYAVAAEFFRVHQHSYNTKTKYWPADVFIFYFNQSHYFAHEPTDFGIQSFDAEVYKSGQAGYRVSVPARRAQIAYNKRVGVATSYYVTGAFGGQMGYEAARQHPEYVLYDANGQWAVDPVYGGHPNPMELASPLEVGPRRKGLKIKPYLDRQYSPWQHVGVNMASEEAVAWGLERMKKYADEWGFDGLYWDGCLGVWFGYGHNGTRNVPSGKYEDYVALGARNHRLFNQILKRDKPNFGTWLNWGLEGATGDWARNQGITIWLGSGVEGDPLDDNVRAATDGRNVMLLDERADFSGYGYRTLLEQRVRSRDHYVQKYGASHIIGYASISVDMHEPGPTKWGWPTWNHILSQLIATQSHLASFFVPSHRPSFQFMTRYSRFLWARDIEVLAPDEAQRVILLRTPEAIWWKRLVYTRKTATGHDLIVHLVRIPPTEKADFAWADEPRPLAGVTITVDTGAAALQSVHACRPYHYEEPQQVVQQTPSPSATSGKVTVTLPPFRYHTMVVFRMYDEE